MKCKCVKSGSGEAERRGEWPDRVGIVSATRPHDMWIAWKAIARKIVHHAQ